MALGDILTTIQQGVTAANNLAQFLTAATTNSSSLRVAINSTYFLPSSAASGFLPTSAASGFVPSSTPIGTVTTINTSYGLLGGPISTSGTLSVSLTTISNSLSSNVAISSAGTYADGPTVAQSTVGTWLATGGITVVTTNAGASNIYAKLWDGTSVIDSANVVLNGANLRQVVPLSGVISSPAGNIRISAANADGVPSSMEANRTGNAKDSTVTAVRVS